MKLTNMTVTKFNDILASDSPAPGGGSAAALEGAVGVALINMVASLTLGKKKYAEFQDLMEEIIKAATALRSQFIEVIDRDTESFNCVSAVFSMPKNTDEEKAERKKAMQEALKTCTYTPYDMMRLALAGLELTRQALGKSNSSAASDLGVAALCLKSSIQGAWLNILINISGIEDRAFADEYREKGQKIIAKALPLADEIYGAVLNELSI